MCFYIDVKSKNIKSSERITTIINCFFLPLKLKLLFLQELSFTFGQRCISRSQIKIVFISVQRNQKPPKIKLNYPKIIRKHLAFSEK